ncbi:hypothetical protein SUDANB95_01236 [Actinosynnema sp. ALI-1.44]
MAGGAFVVGVGGVLLWLSGSEDALDRGDKLASVAGALLATAGLVTSVVALVVAIRGNRSADLRQAANHLAGLVAGQWEREAAARGLTRPLEVGWASTTLPIAPTAADVLGDHVVPGRPTRLKLHGAVPDLADAFLRLPARRLVLIGAPGAGKTSAAVLLTATLARRRAADDPVPVLVSLSSWDPERQGLEEWLTDRIAVDHPVFGKRGTYGPGVARALVDSGTVLPVLDGLDEVAPAARKAAAEGIARAFSTGPLVLTARSEEYEETVGVPLGRAAVVELGSVTPRAAATYLRAGLAEGDRRWDPVVERLDAEPAGALAQALSTPLMVYLAKTAFTTGDPTELLGPTTAAEVEQLLLDAYLPALYPAGERVAVARRSLGFLARRSALGADLAWWRLFLLLPKPHAVVAATRGAILAALMSVLFMVTSVPAEVWVAAPLERLLLVPLAAMSPVTLAGAAIGGLLGPLWAALATRVGRGADAVVPLPRYLDVRAGRVVGFAVAGAVVGALAFAGMSFAAARPDALAAAAQAGAVLGSVSFIGGEVTRRSAPDVQVRPGDGLAADRSTAIVVGALSLVGIVAGIRGWITALGGVSADATLFFAATFGVVVVFFRYLSCAWVKFGIARFWFGVLGKLPWRLMGFLEDAHRRGVLRQVGGSYQFRHLRIQEFLAGR